MITYHNSGHAGRDYSRLLVMRIKENVELQVAVKDEHSDVQLSRAQALHLAKAILAHYGEKANGEPEPPMIEGTTL